MTTPARVQRSRSKGWKAPPDTVIVTRPGRFGNPWAVSDERKWGNGWVVLDPAWSPRPLRHYCESRKAAHQLAVDLFRAWVESNFGPNLGELRGQNLACWCAPDMPCHADVLLEIANR